MSISLKCVICFVGAVLMQSSSAGVCAQSLIRVLERDYWPNGVDVFPPRLKAIEDRDGDGLSEFLIGDSSFGLFHQATTGKVSVVSSVSGLELGALTGPGSGIGSDAAALGDVNGDDIGDFGSASFNTPSGGIWIWSGSDLSLLYRDTFPGIGIASIGDVTGDGLRDVAYGNGLLHVLAGGSFEELYVLDPEPTTRFYGWNIVSLGDVSGDRVPDFAVSAPGYPNPIFGPCRQAWIFVYSGKDGEQLYRIDGQPACDFLGFGMAAPGDVNGDGVVDLAATAGFECVKFFDGNNGALLGEACDQHNQLLFGRVVESVGDVNANGFGDVLVYGGNMEELPPPYNRSGMGEAWLVDGGTREFLYRASYPRPLSSLRHITYAEAFTACGDWNADGQPDLAIAAPGTPTSAGASGVIDIISGHPFGVRSLPEACARPADGPRIGSSGVPVLGRLYPIHLKP